MANTFKNYTSTAATGGTTVYTVPNSTVAVAIGINLSNTTTSAKTASVQVGSVYLIKNVSLPAGASLSVLDGKLILEAADTLVVTASANSSVDVILSVLEQT